MSCENVLTCCPVNPFQGSPPTGITPQLEGLLWVMPCTSIVPLSGGGACFCSAPPDSVSTMVGDVSQLYDVTFLVRGVFEYAKYTGGTILPGTGNAAIAGATPVADGHNRYSLIVSSPSQTYYLNGWDSVPANYGVVHALRYTVVIPVNSGAVITLRADNGGDGIEIANFTGSVLPLTNPDPAFNAAILPQPYQTPGTNGYGQWLQADAIGIA